MAQAHFRAGRPKESIPHYEQILQIMSALSTEHPQEVLTVYLLADACYRAGRINKAQQLFEQLRIKTNLGVAVRVAATTTLADIYSTRGRPDEAIALLNELLDTLRTARGVDHPETLLIMHNLAFVLTSHREFDQAFRTAEELIPLIRRQKPPDKKLLAMAHTTAAESLLGLGRDAEAQSQITQVTADDLNEQFRLRVASIRGALLAKDGRWEEAESLLVESAEALATQISELKAGQRWYASRACERVIAMYDARGNSEDAAKWQAKLDEVDAEIIRLRNDESQPTHSHTPSVRKVSRDQTEASNHVEAPSNANHDRSSAENDVD
jgi:tetratricopeptide (TPR) repeat protein